MAKVLNASTDGTLGGLNASNDIIVGQKAIKDYVDSKNLGVLSDTEGNILVGAVGSTILTIDAALSTTSTNPVQNKVITNTINDKLDTSLSNLSSAGQKVLDGSWVKSNYVIYNSEDLTNTTGSVVSKSIDLSSYLPNDGYDYEVKITWWLGAEIPTNVGSVYNVSCGLVDAYSTYAYLDFASVYKASSTVNVVNSGLGTGIYVVSTSRKLTLVIYNGSHGHMADLSALAYKRLGTNT